MKRIIAFGIVTLALAAIFVPPVEAAGRRFQAGDFITRNKFGISADFTIPKANVVTTIPFDVVRLQEGNDISLTAEGYMQVNVSGLYYVHLGLDWKAQEQTDIDTRMYGLRRLLPGQAPSLQDERLASFDHPGSDSPRVYRYQGEWTPGVIAYGSYAVTEINTTPAGAKIGDVVTASLTSISDTNLGVAANNSLTMEARIVGPSKIRVIVRNMGSPGGVAVPSGTLNVLAQSATLDRGDSEDAWNVLSTPMVYLNAGDRVYVAAKNRGIAGDYIQASLYSTFVQFERFGLPGQ